MKNPGSPQQYTPVCFIAWRHQFEHVPYFVIPERRGTITGNVFRDDQSKGAWEPGMPPMPEVEVMLDDRRRTLTGADGSYRFPNVHRGKHKIEALYTSKEPFFFTTPSDLEVDEDATVNFGIGYSLSGLTGQVLNDAGQGVAGVSVAIESRGKKWSATTEADGSFFVGSLVAGDYDVQADGDSLPAGYSADGFGDPQRVTVGATSPGKAAFTARAFRSISGRVLSYDTTAGRYVPVVRAQVILREPGSISTTDPLGRYLFRDLAAGSYTLSVQNEAKTPARTVRLGAQPVDLTNVDFEISRPALSVPAPVAPPEKLQPPEAKPASPAANPAPTAIPAKPQPPATSAPGPIPAAAELHNTRGRELSAAGRYREAIVELTEALRLAPDFALAFNARGFARFKLHDWAGAIKDLDQAILLNPKYANAYRIRAVARKSMGAAAKVRTVARKPRRRAH